VKRKFGDCKDQATLLTALLRAKGIPASVALLQTGPGQDLEAELPGLGRFDHAIVYVPGSPDLWIDPTSTYSRAGELPLSVQGRLALVAAPDSQELIRTPATESQDNGAVEQRHVVLADFGRGNVRESTIYRGSLERGLRSLYASTDPELIREKVREYTVSSYFADDATVEHSDPRDLSSPFNIEIEAQGTKRASSDLTDGAVGIDTSYLLSNLPAFVVADEPAREKPFALDEPHRMEIHYLIEPPAGMKVSEMPDDEEQHFGGATFSLAGRELETGAVEIDLVFDTGPRVISAEDFEELRRGVEALAEREILIVQFQHTAQALLAAGKVREAIEENQRIARLEPDKAIHRVRLAQSLLGAGLQGAALRETSRAVELDPSSATAFWALGWVQQHDDMGRRFGEGFDYESAVVSLRQAKELDPTHRMARAELAILLEHNSAGVQFGSGADLEAAVAEHLSFREDFDSEAMNVNIMLGLLQSGRFEELEEITEKLPESEPRSLHRLVALTVNHGVDRALSEVAREYRDAEDRVSNLSVVAQELIRLGRSSPTTPRPSSSGPDSWRASALSKRSRSIRAIRRASSSAWSS
jgi:tetratricopeptide (TPR) repeat protein